MVNSDQKSLFEISKSLVPGGVHSPVRSFKGLHTTPRFIKRSEGAYVYDVEDKSYIDFCMSFGPLILGHRNPQVENALKQGLENGWTYGACEPYSIELATCIIEKIPFIEQIRFVNSGTEAVMTALRLARGYTKKNKIIKFNGCYHGHVDSMLIKAGSGLAGTSEASSAGVSQETASETLILELGDESGVRECFKNNPDNIAAIIIEPLPANNGLLSQTQEFLEFLRSIASEHNSLLIFDEVISGFRVGFDGMAGKTGIKPDLVTYGKVIGGGLPVGALAGSKEIMEHLAPVGPVYQAGTLSANPLAMVGGLSTLTQLDGNTYKKIEENTERIVNLFKKWFNEFDNGKFSYFNIVSESSLFWIVAGDDIKKVSDIPENITELFNPLFEELLDRGIYLSPNAYEVGFVSLAHNEDVAKELEKRLWQ